jgi:cyanophycinase
MAKILSFLFFLPVLAFGQPADKGSLVVVGGGLESETKSIFQQLIDLAGGLEQASFAVIPSATGVPVQSFVYIRDVLVSHGVHADNIHLIPVAVVDDDSTQTVNEAEWKDNGDDENLAALVRKCSGVWFTGGDQLRTTGALLHPDGSPKVVLRAVWDVYRSGGVVAGTSAGAAIMSERMIGGGTSLAALQHGVIRDYAGNDFPADSGVLMTRGLGFFPHGIVDQHFNERGRLGRLAVALTGTGGGMAFGIDENTAMIYHASTKWIQVAGEGGVTVLNARTARLSKVKELPKIENLSLSYLEEGDVFDCATGQVLPAEGKQAIAGKEVFSETFPHQLGLFSVDPYSFREIYTRYLIDNAQQQTVNALTFTGQGTGIDLILKKEKNTRGYCSGTGRDRKYTIVGINMDLIPVRVITKDQ